MTINKIIKGFIIFICLFSIALILNVAQKAVLTKAADIPVDNSPKGLNFDDYFVRGSFRGNSADTTFKNGDTSIIQVTPKQGGSIGGVWSNDKANNYIDLNMKQTLSMWMYFGYESDPADGLAFILQNSGYDAISMDGNLPAKGQTMGVWGIDNEPLISDSQNLANKAIQNSWAMEFDTHKNVNKDIASVFKDKGWDLGVNPETVNNGFDGNIISDNRPVPMLSHIGDNYPAQASSYTSINGLVSQTGVSGPQKTAYVYQLLHRNLKFYYKAPGSGATSSLNLSNGLWHHLVITWTPPESGSTIGHLSYALDDKIHTGEATAGNNAQPISQSDIPIETSYFYSNAKQQFSKSEGKVLWGFTGSTGTQYARNMVVFESIPSIVEGTVSASIFDDSQNGKELSSTDKNVYNYDQLRFVYNVKRDSGALDWTNIVANINLPKNTLYGSGTIKYSDGTSEVINSNELTTSKFSRKLKNLLKDKDPNSATITLNAVAYSSTPSKDTNVDATDVSFAGDDLIKNTQLQDFVIKTTPMILTPDKLNLDIGDASSVDATGKISYIGLSGGIDNSSITIHYSINDNSEQTTGLASGTDGKMKITVPRSSLNDGSNSLTVYASDKEGNRSNYVTYTITKPTAAPILIDADKNMYFKTVRSNGKDQTVRREGNWKLNVIDNDTNTSNWLLSATAVQAPDSNKLDGDLVYVDGLGSINSILNGSIIEIANKNNFPSDQIINNSTYQIANTWSENDGILLKAKSTAKSGTYKYTVTWSLTDSVH